MLLILLVLIPCIWLFRRRDNAWPAALIKGLGLWALVWLGLGVVLSIH